MWEQIESARAIYRSRSGSSGGDDRQLPAGPCSISVDGPGGSRGCQLTCDVDRECRGEGSENRNHLAAFQIHPASATTMPQLSESYVRGEDFVLHYAQQESDSFGLAVQVTPIEANGRMAVIQLTISLQTELLDSHPAIELSAAAVDDHSDRSLNPAVIGPRLLPVRDEQDVYGTVLLSPRDQQAAEDCSGGEALRVQLFGNFLEKGVIRKSRPWVVVWRGGPPEAAEIGTLYQRLCQTPLPLTT